jgi:hypothetical protein
MKGRDNSVCITTMLTTGVRLPAGARDFSPLHSMQTGSEAHPAFYLRLICIPVTPSSAEVKYDAVMPYEGYSV